MVFILAASALPGALPWPDAVPDSTLLPESGEAGASLSAADQSGLRAAYEAHRHAVCWEADDSLSARNPGQRWLTRFDGRGFTATPDGDGWAWGLELRGYGFAGAEQETGGSSSASSSAATVSSAENRVTYTWSAGMEEWFVNDERGLEQGWTLARRPPGGHGVDSPLRLTLAVRGGLRPECGGDDCALSFTDAAGAGVLTYSGLKAWDADGKALPARFEMMTENAAAFRVVVDERGARYPVTIDPVAQQAYLKAPNTEAEDGFGFSVAISGDTVVVGAPLEDSDATGVNGNQSSNSAPNSGAAYVFVRNGAAWSLQAYLKASNTGEDDTFGRSVAVNGNTVVVGAPWENSNATGVNGNQSNNGAAGAGAVYVFVRNGTTWSQQAYLKASNTDASDNFGFSVAVSRNTLVVGAGGEDSSSNRNQGNDEASNAGAAYVFVRSGTEWTQQAYLKASNAGSGDLFGYSVSISDESVVVGAPNESSPATGVNGNENNTGAMAAGAAYVFVRSGLNWSQQAYLKASNTGQQDFFGVSVAMAGSTVVVGAPSEDSSANSVNGVQTNNSATEAGAAYVFNRTGTDWSQQAYLKASNTDAGDRFGNSVAISGGTVVVGAPFEAGAGKGINDNPTSNSAPEAGAAYVFSRTGTSWTQQAYLKASNTGPDDAFGTSVAVAGSSVVVGALREDSHATTINGDGNSNSAANSGAAYVFAGFTPPELKITAFQSVRNANGSYTVHLSGLGLSQVLHTLQSSPDMSDGSWQDIAMATAELGGFFTFGPITEPASRTRRFYRVAVP